MTVATPCYTGRVPPSPPHPSGACRVTRLSPDASIALPVTFFTETLPAIDDLAELRVTLHLYYRVAGGEALIAEADLLADPALRRGLLPLGSARDPAEPIRRGLEAALSRGTV